MNRRTFLKVVLGTAVVLALDPFKVVADTSQQVPKREPEFTIEKVPVESVVHERKPGLEIKSNPSPFDELRKEGKIIDVVRVFYPTLIAHQLCSVQPMTQTTGEIFKIRYVPKPWYKRIGTWFNRTPKLTNGGFDGRFGE